MNEEILRKIKVIIDMQKKAQCPTTKGCATCKYMNLCETIHKLDIILESI